MDLIDIYQWQEQHNIIPTLKQLFYKNFEDWALKNKEQFQKDFPVTFDIKRLSCVYLETELDNTASKHQMPSFFIFFQGRYQDRPMYQYTVKYEPDKKTEWKLSSEKFSVIQDEKRKAFEVLSLDDWVEENHVLRNAQKSFLATFDHWRAEYPDDFNTTFGSAFLSDMLQLELKDAYIVYSWENDTKLNHICVCFQGVYNQIPYFDYIVKYKPQGEQWDIWDDVFAFKPVIAFGNQTGSQQGSCY